MPQYSREPCFKDCWGDGLHNAHYHEVGGEDMIRKISDDEPEAHDTVQLAADESVALPYKPTPGLGPDPNRTKPYFTIEGRIDGKAPDVLGLKRTCYGLCAAIVLCCLVYVIWIYWPHGW